MPDDARLRSLSFWKGPISIEPLPGGITNRNYQVDDGHRRYVARLCDDKRHLGIDRRNEVACQTAAHALGVAPEILHEEPGVLVSAYLDARPLRPEEVGRPDVLNRLASELRLLHGGWRQVSGMILFFGPLQTVLTYARTATDLGASRPKELSTWLADAQELAGRLRPFRPVLCHNDLLAANLLDEPTSGRIRLVDWEYSGMGHPLFDLANAASNADLDADGEVALLEAYASRIDPKALCELRLLRVLSSLREALWAVIQTVASDLDFDYHAYANLHFDAYQARRSRLDLYALDHSH